MHDGFADTSNEDSPGNENESGSRKLWKEIDHSKQSEVGSINGGNTREKKSAKKYNF